MLRTAPKRLRLRPMMLSIRIFFFFLEGREFHERSSLKTRVKAEYDDHTSMGTVSNLSTVWSFSVEGRKKKKKKGVRKRSRIKVVSRRANHGR